MNAALSHNGGVGISRGGSRLVGVLSSRLGAITKQLACRLAGGHTYLYRLSGGRVRLACVCGKETTGWEWLART
jgi:hypothetical protein